MHTPSQGVSRQQQQQLFQLYQSKTAGAGVGGDAASAALSINLLQGGGGAGGGGAGSGLAANLSAFKLNMVGGSWGWDVLRCTVSFCGWHVCLLTGARALALCWQPSHEGIPGCHCLILTPGTPAECHILYPLPRRTTLLRWLPIFPSPRWEVALVAVSERVLPVRQGLEAAQVAVQPAYLLARWVRARVAPPLAAWAAAAAGCHNGAGQRPSVQPQKTWHHAPRTRCQRCVCVCSCVPGGGRFGSARVHGLDWIGMLFACCHRMGASDMTSTRILTLLLMICTPPLLPVTPQVGNLVGTGFSRIGTAFGGQDG